MSFLLRKISNPVLVGIAACKDGDTSLRRSITELTLGAWHSAFIRRAAEVIGIEVRAPRGELGGATNGGNICHTLIGRIIDKVHWSHVVAKSRGKVRFHTIDITNNHW